MSLNAIHKLPPLPGAARIDQAPAATPPRTRASGGAFDTMLEREVRGSQPVNFSAHAQSRLVSRQIQLTDTQLARLQNGVEQAAQKGAKDSLVMLDNLAFIVNVPNRKVVTALDGANTQGNVFTQIDSAVIV
ncbi:hypothetical protein HZB60_00865 [candidate division KSB1 bacterium]|nr:hypothetical protein [candidate division KSB1 bacterium]